jgi:murein L,D-transpeptidase YcbB/YkuD
VDPRTLDVHWNIEPEEAAQSQLLEAARQAVDDRRIGEAFDAARPQHPAYATLRNVLARLYKTSAVGGWPAVPEGPDLKAGMTDARVAALRQRLAAGGYLPEAELAGETFDEDVTQAVRLFQSEQYLPETGVVGRATRAALNVPVKARIEQLRVNLERARWVMHEIHGDFVLVDVAGYRLQHFIGAKPVWSTRVQVGRMTRQTPIIKSTITRVTFNPAWNVPPTILNEDVAPSVRKDPGYLRKNHLRIFDNRGRELRASDVDWDDPEGVSVRQDPGPWGALGRIAIRFSSPYMIYLHETPHVDLFAKAQRNFSSGCIRVEEPYALAGRLLGWNQAQMDAMLVTNETREVPLPRPVPIFILYWTISLKPDGRVAFKPDPYRMDPPALAALNEPFAGAEL